MHCHVWQSLLLDVNYRWFLIRLDTNRRTAVSKFFDVVLDLSGYPRVSVSFLLGQDVHGFLQWPDPRSPTLSLVLFHPTRFISSCAKNHQFSIMNEYSMLQVVMCCFLSFSSRLARLRCASDLPAPRTQCTHQAAVRDVRQFVFLKLLPTVKPQAIRCCAIVSVLFLWINKEFDLCLG